MAILNKEIKLFKDENKNKIFNDCFNNTYDTTLKILDNNKTYLITGDIPAMWLRDSTAQVMQYLYYSEDENVRKLIRGLIKTQFELLVQDPYANAFMESEESTSMWAQYVKSDKMPKIVWERKYELDSLCWPFFLAKRYIEKTNDTSILDNDFIKAFDVMIDTIKKEQNHSKLSSYFFEIKVPWRDDTEACGLNENPLEEKGLVWSGFRPSDDKCQYHYHIPDNMFLVSVLYSLEKVFKNLLKDKEREHICSSLVSELKNLIEKYGVVEIKGLGKIYVSETDCIDKWHANDDANVPSLLSIPYLEYPFIDKEIYSNTRKFILSKNNKYYYEGKILKGIGSPHTPKDMVWPIALSMQGLTSDNIDEINECSEMLFKTAVGNGLMHEAVDVNNPNKYTRPWFSWSNSLFAEFLLKIHK